MTWLLSSLRVLIACEFSGVFREAFLSEGHDAWSCDLLPAEDGSNRHHQCDVREILDDDWDLLMVAHPPCTRLCNSGVRWLTKPPPGRTLEEMWDELRVGAELFSELMNAPIERIAMENPIMHKHARALIPGHRKADQIVQPHWFGDPAFKATGFHLKNLPPLKPTNKLTPPKKGTDEHKQWSAVLYAPPGPDRWKIRSRSWPGMAAAAAQQWGDHALLHKTSCSVEVSA